MIKHKPYLETISQVEKRYLCQVARNALIVHLELSSCEDNNIPNINSDKLQMSKTVFVTLWRNAQLRGCCGLMEASMPLIKAVEYLAISAATRDWRFMPLEADELNEIVIEISILSENIKMKSIDEIILGKHGVLVKKGQQSGVFLPQVAIECGWDKETLLDEACKKAGLPEDVWRNEAEVYLFESVKFSESDH